MVARSELKGACHVKRLPGEMTLRQDHLIDALLEPRQRGSFFLLLALNHANGRSSFSRPAPLLRAVPTPPSAVSRFPEYSFSKFFGGFSEPAEAV
jgi:hypothetical protein